MTPDHDSQIHEAQPADQGRRPRLLRHGLCSVTFRPLPVVKVIELAVSAGLSVVEWGADIHVPPGDLAVAREVRSRTAEAGLAVGSYGTYVYLGPDCEFGPVIAGALALGAPRIRVWAGRTGSAAVTAAERAAVVASARELAARAEDAGLTVGLEFHDGSLTDTAESTLALLADIDRPVINTYWQPPPGLDDGATLAGLDLILPHVIAVHACSLSPTGRWLPLDARRRLWEAVVARLVARGVPTDVLLEFVLNDDPLQFAEDAQALDAIIRGA
ncbi:sugar phosphate isomerase/epimerase [Acrocarpospora macrocephala]|uniref:Sugar phosphate isomerase n=1 Tax=Acrocarpospora macrocephala TaxID=150177 RepID=A0A5M3WZ66_9ACTN|nr:TIM barrel protein [Acrocarpospora macrocephala]GES14264.1 sugar phosphate isomerase [Acrocarpospora macrocephala]